ncbi:GNAT family N-acetyltransferase [Aspergillus novofumigatus IBT 16806]|uniref:Acetyltransferase, GNAT family n=1 Tax=Aspergillus novofumigatus (strain IBT 16806) TaxID=1392255 RepID=A0A2I1CD75_ASPN1|nr:acetyltransferase, GNAT family [Aspergillus novofumigatus IBT 16806]PKX95579.1 acetyltransferase, GNAT family [Aspergillus novofumigatus IBT 16806]
MPILINPITNEPYIPSPPPFLHHHHPGAPPNADDSSALLSLLNNPQIYPYLESTPVPYLPEHATAWLQTSHEQSTALLHAAQTNRFVDGLPFTCIREVTGDSNSDVYIGNVGLVRYAFYEFKKGSPKREEAVRRNEALGVGSPEIVWGFGDYLSPTHHGKGIMTAVIKAVIEEWAVPRMNARVIKASAYADNRASMRVFEKNGFRLEYELEDWAVVPLDRGGGVKSIVVLSEGDLHDTRATDS